MDTKNTPKQGDEKLPVESPASTDEVVEAVEPATELEGVEQEGGHVFYGYDDSNSRVDANALSEAE